MHLSMDFQERVEGKAQKLVNSAFAIREARRVYLHLVGNRIKKAIPGRQERAQKLVEDLCVKRHIFRPSQREIWTVVGNDGDNMVNFSLQGEKPFCSCSDFHFRVLGGEITECYHLIAARIALRQGKFSKTEFSDEEYESFLGAVLVDLFSRE